MYPAHQCRTPPSPLTGAGPLLGLLLGLLTQPAAAEPTKASGFTNALHQQFIQLPPVTAGHSAPARRFTMGTPKASLAFDGFAYTGPDGRLEQIEDESPAHAVAFKHSFYMARTEVTQAQWLALMGSKSGPDSHWQRKDWRTLPVVSVSWNMTQAFINKLNQQDPGHAYRLPTEAEWEYAARAGSKGIRPFEQDALNDYAWSLQNSGDRPHPVATRKPNVWGLYDTYGNAWEWVADRYAADTYRLDARQGLVIDPQGPVDGAKRVRRGGSYHCPPHLVRSAYRAADTPDTRYSVLGFRLVAER